VTSIEHFRRRLPSFVTELRELVAIETPTGHVVQANQAADWLAGRLSGFGDLTTETLPGYGRVLRLHRPGTAARVLLVGHYDTVWPIGSWPQPWRESGGRAFGPGVYDMKGGLLFLIELLRRLDAAAIEHPTLDVIINPDEEVGSPGSRRAIEALAAASDVALVLEPTTADGVIKVARKGSGEVTLTVRGRSAHQGAEPERGVNAVVEAAHQVLRLLELDDRALGTTVGPNLITAGSASNVVPDLAVLKIDVRAWTAAEQRRLDRGLAGLRPVLEGSTLELTGGWNRPPMEPTAASMALFERAREVGRGLGLDLRAARWGGSSDANLTAAAGTPTIDGLGPAGEGSHQLTESIFLDAVPARLALLCRLVESLVDPPIPSS
jgi:glutamate carboxypeptidase